MYNAITISNLKIKRNLNLGVKVVKGKQTVLRMSYVMNNMGVPMTSLILKKTEKNITKLTVKVNKIGYVHDVQ